MKVKVSLIGVLDMLKFKNLKKNRLNAINNSEIKPYKEYEVNKLADYYHPKKQYLIIKEIVEENKDTKSFYLIPDEEYNDKLAYFKSGSYISLFVNVDNNIVSRAYAISSSPKQALENIYRITVKRKEDGYLSNYLLDKAKVGDKLFASEPGGFLTYSSIRDAKNVIAIAGGVGITPFISMAKAINDGIEDFNLTIIYGVNKVSDIIFKNELDNLSSNSKIKVIYVIRDEEVSNCEKGFISAEIIKKYAPKDEKYSIFASGPNGMLDYLNSEISKLNIANKYFRIERSPETLNLENKEFTIKIHCENEVFSIKAMQNETILNALERSNLLIRSKCHLGGCGYCRSKILKGEIKTTKLNKQAEIDKKFNYFHPCCSYPVSDLEIEVYKY